MEIKYCKLCGNIFLCIPYKAKKRFLCSQKCAVRYKKINYKSTKIQYICQTCKKLFYRYPSRGISKFCSHSCCAKAFTGKNNPMYGVIRSGKDAPMWGKHLSKEAKDKIRQSALKRPFPSLETRKKLATWKGRKHTEETKRKMSQTRRSIWKDPDFRLLIKSVYPQWTSVRPNGLEKKIITMTDNNIEYIGNGKWWRLLPNGKRKNPDFKVKNQNKVIEVFGNYWHSQEEVNGLINQYKQIGIDCLVLWEKEINNYPQIVQNKISKFCELSS